MFMTIYQNNPINLKKLKLFERFHSGHPIQTVNLCEIDEDYLHIRIKTEKEREYTLQEIHELLGKIKNDIKWTNEWHLIKGGKNYDT